MNLNKNTGGINKKLMENIHNSIWLHNNKKKFLSKSSIICYLNKISNIETTNQEILLAKQKYIKLLHGIKKEIEGYEELVFDNTYNMSFNLNVSQDIARLKDTRRLEQSKTDDTYLNQCVMFNPSISESDDLPNMSQIPLTNDNFQYSDLHITLDNHSDNISKDKNKFDNLNSTEPTVDSGIESVSDYHKSTKKRKLTHENYDGHKQYAFEEADPFINPQTAEERLEELTSMIKLFEKFVLEHINNVVAEQTKSIECHEKQPVQINPFFFNINNPVHSSSLVGQPNQTTNLENSGTSCEQLSIVYVKKFNELFKL